MSYIKFPSAQLESLWFLGLFPLMFTRALTCFFFFTFTPYPICYSLNYGIYLFICTNVLTFDWWRGLQFSNKNYLHHKCLKYATCIYGNCKQVLNFQHREMIHFRSAQSKIIPRKSTQSKIIHPRLWFACCPKAVTVIFLVIKASRQVSALSLCCNSASCNVICA